MKKQVLQLVIECSDGRVYTKHKGDMLKILNGDYDALASLEPITIN